MWYITSQNKTKAKEQGLEEKILEGDAEQSVRRRLFLAGDYNPDSEQIRRYTNKVMKQILDKYGNYNVVRHYMSGELLMPAVDEIVAKIIKTGH